MNKQDFIKFAEYADALDTVPIKVREELAHIHRDRTFCVDISQSQNTKPRDAQESRSNAR